MLTRDLSEAYEKMPEAAKQTLLALSILIDRIGALPEADRDDWFELFEEWRKADSPEEQQSIRRAMEEILAQAPLAIQPFPLVREKAMGSRRQSWAEHVGRTIRQLREQAGLTQIQLAEKAGLPQSHISRLENAEHSATHLTLEKIAKALNVSVDQIAPQLV